MPLNMDITENPDNNIDENENENENEQQQKQESVTETNDKVEIPKVLLTNIKSIIDVTSTRGVFKPNEMTIVGKLYEEILSYLKD